MQREIDASLVRFIDETKRFPVLSLQREQSLATAWRENGDRMALEHLLGSHLRLVVKTARGFSGYGVALSDLVAEGNMGLIQAAEKFDPERGARFATYAIWWIRAAMQGYVLRSWSLVTVGTTAAQKKLFFNLRRLKSALNEFDQRNLLPESVTAIARNLDVRESDVIEMNGRLTGTDNSLNAMVGDNGEGEWLELLPDERPSHEMLIGDVEEAHRRRSLLRAALTKLNPREREIVVQRHMEDEPATLEELSRRYAVSCERIRQIEVCATEKLRRLMRHQRTILPVAEEAPDGMRSDRVRSDEGRIATDEATALCSTF
jgi:RNA polymerase sigma-32 factor